MQMFTRVRAILRACTPGLPIIVLVAASTAFAKTPGSTYCFYGKCHRVKTIAETQALVGKEVSLYSSHYDSCHRDRYNPCGLTSSGEPFFADRADNAASPIYPDGTKLLVWSPISKQAAVIRINNAGPYWGNRKLDVSRALARKMGFEHRGVAKLQVRILSAPTRAEARYKRNRRYAKVKGPIGKFDSMEDAEKGLAVLLSFDAIAASTMAPAAGNAVATVKRPFEVAAAATGGRAFAEVAPALQQWPIVGRQFAALAWPVVRTPATVAEKTKSRVHVAMAWPVVKAGKAIKSTAGERGRVVKRKKTRKTRVASLRKKNKRTRRAMQKRKRKVQAKKSYKVASAKRSKSKVRVTSGVTGKRVVRRMLPVQKAKPKPPYVATRQILHRALGRNAS